MYKINEKNHILPDAGIGLANLYRTGKCKLQIEVCEAASHFVNKKTSKEKKK